jgi:phosphate transport system substrate-binding protein
MIPASQAPESFTTVTLPFCLTLTLCFLALAVGGACQKGASPDGAASGETASPGSENKLSIQNIGSDTMVNLAQAWAEEYANVEPKVSVEVSGGGSGVGIAALINGTADIANSSRKLEPAEEAQVKQNGRATPTEFLVGYDGLAIYVSKTNPIERISMEELAEIYREDGRITKWSKLGVQAIPGAKSDEIIRISRQNNSGTYHYFRERVAGKTSDLKLGSLDMSGSKDVVEQVAKTPGAIGYSGLGYATPAVKIVKVSKAKGEPGVLPSVSTVHDGSYPISRPMFMYTPSTPAAHVKKYIDWTMSEAGQKILEHTGYVPLAN